MDNKGFTLIEILGVLIVVAAIIALTLPGFMSIQKDIKNSDYLSKVPKIELAASKYGDSIKDEIKDMESSCMDTNAEFLIKKGYLLSESKKENMVFSPVDNSPMNKDIRVCYCKNSYEIKSFYLEDFNPNGIYLAKTKVKFDGKMYITNEKYIGKNIKNKSDRTINYTREEKDSDGNKVNIEYFSEITC